MHLHVKVVDLQWSNTSVFLSIDKKQLPLWTFIVESIFTGSIYFFVEKIFLFSFGGEGDKATFENCFNFELSMYVCAVCNIK